MHKHGAEVPNCTDGSLVKPADAPFGQRHTAWLMHIHRLGPRCEWHSHLGGVGPFWHQLTLVSSPPALRQQLTLYHYKRLFILHVFVSSKFIVIGLYDFFLFLLTALQYPNILSI